MTTLTSTPTTSPGAAALKARMLATWSAGDYGQIGVRLQIVGETLCEAVDLLPSERVLDVAAGNGNASLAAARRYADVTSTDFVPALLEHGRIRAEADRLPIAFQIADIEQLPFPDASFDVALSTFGVMFVPNQERAAAELLRVVKPGGRIGLASWTPEGFVGDLFKLVGSFVPPPAGVRSPTAWGSETRLVELFGPRATDIRTTRKHYVFRFRSAEHFVEVFRSFYGPTHRAFAALAEDKQQELHHAMVALLNAKNVSKRNALVIPGEYLEVVVTT